MGFIRQRHEYIIEQFKPTRLTEVYKLIKTYLSRHLGIVGEYNAEWDVYKDDGQKLKGKLFRTLDGKGMRFNWKQTDTIANIISIDLWKEVELGGQTRFINNPDITIELNGNSVSNALKNITSFFKDVHNELIDNNNINTEKAQQEDSSPVTLVGMDVKEMEKMDLDIFKTIKYRVYQTAYGYANSLIITGMSGVGKTYDTEKALSETGKEFTFVKGGISTAGLFRLLFLHHDELIVFDDCDSVFTGREKDNNVNILKAALDSMPKRTISRYVETYFDTKGMTMNDIICNYNGNSKDVNNRHLFKKENRGKLPKTFVFSGQIIFISNLDVDEFDPTIITRSTAHIDINLTHEEILDRMRSVMENINKEVPMKQKEEVLQLIDYLTMNFETRHPLSIRALVNAINTRMSNDMLVPMAGKRIPLWQLLIKQDMLGKNAKRKTDF